MQLLHSYTVSALFEKSKRIMKYALPILLIVPMTTLTVHELILQPHLNPSNTSCDVIIPFNAQALIYFEASTAMGYGLCGVSSLYFTNVPPGAFFPSRIDKPLGSALSLLCFSQKKQLNRRLLPSGERFHDSDFEF
jgi:hypothetical protein